MKIRQLIVLRIHIRSPATCESALMAINDFHDTLNISNLLAFLYICDTMSLFKLLRNSNFHWTQF